MGYPPPGYPQGHPGYPQGQSGGYQYPPPPGYPPPYPGYQPYAGHPPPPYPPYTGNRSSGFCTAFCSICLLLIIFTLLGVAVFWLIFRPQVPAFHVESFNVTNFDLATDILKSTWDVGMIIENDNKRMKVQFKQIQSFVYFTNNEEDLLAWSVVDLPEKDFEIGKRKNATIHTKLMSDDPNKMVKAPEKKVIDDMRRERKNNAVPFNLKMISLAVIKNWWWSNKLVRMRVYCKELRVVFQDEAAINGALQPGKIKTCKIYA